MDQTEYGFNEHLLSLAKFLNRSGPSASSGIRTKLNPKEDCQARRIKSIKEKNKVNFNLQGMKRKLDCITSGSSEFESSVHGLLEGQLRH